MLAQYAHHVVMYVDLGNATESDKKRMLALFERHKHNTLLCDYVEEFRT